MLKRLLLSLGIMLGGFVLLMIWPHQEAADIYSAQPGQALPGLSAKEQQIFARGMALFKHEYTPEQGLGPLFNGRSCFECHGQPQAAGLEGKDVVTTGATFIGRLRTGEVEAAKLVIARQLVDSSNFDPMIEKGGPVIQRRSITREFPELFSGDCRLSPFLVPPEALFVSLRHAGPVLGMGLIQAIDDATLVGNMIAQAKVAPQLVGRTNAVSDPLTQQTRIGRFGWKGHQPDLLLFTAEALNNEMGVSTYISGLNRSARGYPRCIFDYLPSEPNDKGEATVLLSDFEALLAPPPEPTFNDAARRGGKLFKQLQCAVCHTPELTTSERVEIPDPFSPFPGLRYIEVKALENQPVRLYSDLLLHDMGPELADGIVQGTANGGEWRTTPLWGLRYKKVYLHNGRAVTIDEAVRAHGGQSQQIKENYLRLSEKDKQDLLTFLNAL